MLSLLSSDALINKKYDYKQIQNMLLVMRGKTFGS